MDSVIINDIDYWNLEAQKYWSFPNNYSIDKKKIEAKVMVTSGNYIGSRKMDGFWSMIIKDTNGNLYLRSRTPNVNGGFINKIDWVPHIKEELLALPNGTVIIGEIYFPNNEGSRKVTTVLNCLKEKCIERQEKGEFLSLYIFDILSYNNKNLLDTPIEKRVNNYLNTELKTLFFNSTYIKIAEYKEKEELWDLYGEIIAAGGEGIVITKKSCKYMPGKRTARMTLKMKKELTNTIDAFIDGDYKLPTKLYTGKEIENWKYWFNEKTKEKYEVSKFAEYTKGGTYVPITKAFYYDWVSAISLSLMKDGKPTHIAWISGITDEIKEGIVKSPEKYKNKVVELTAMEVENINGEYSLRHGKIECWREDKRPEDCEWSQIEDKRVF